MRNYLVRHKYLVLFIFAKMFLKLFQKGNFVIFVLNIRRKNLYLNIIEFIFGPTNKL